MKVFRLPLLQRFTCISLERAWGSPSELRVVDGVGLFVYKDSKHQKDKITDDVIRRHLTGLNQTHCIIEADNLILAIETFYREWEGARTGEKGRPALCIADKSEAQSYECPRIKFNKKHNEYLCYDKKVSTVGNAPSCRVSGYDPREDCECKIREYDLNKMI